MGEPETQAVTAADVAVAIDARYPKDKGWLCFHEIGMEAIREAGAPRWAAKDRRADALVVNFFASRNLFRIGIEVKVSRGDWLRELRDPIKAEAIYSVVHEFWLAAPSGVVERSELPPGWGLLEMTRRDNAWRLRQVVQAKRAEPRDPPLGVLGRILRRVFDLRARESAAHDAGRLEREVAQLRATLDKERAENRDKIASLAAGEASGLQGLLDLARLLGCWVEPKTKAIQWGRLDPELVKDFCESARHGPGQWGSRNVRDHLRRLEQAIEGYRHELAQGTEAVTKLRAALGPDEKEPGHA